MNLVIIVALFVFIAVVVGIASAFIAAAVTAGKITDTLEGVLNDYGTARARSGTK